MRIRTKYLLYQGTQRVARTLNEVFQGIKYMIREVIDLCLDYWFSTLCFTVAIALWISVLTGGK